MKQNFDSLRDFDYAQAEVYLWVFKHSASPNKFLAHYVRTDETLDGILRGVVTDEMGRLTEFAPYTYLAESNENSCLSMVADQSNFPNLKTLVDRHEPDHAVQSVKDMMGADGYVVKFSDGAKTVYAVKRSTSSWKTKYPKKYINMIFQNGELSATQDTTFSIERNFDFYFIDETLFIARKRAFESAMAHREGYVQAFSDLQQDASFAGMFTNMQPLIDYVGTNSIQLRRMAVVEQKALYAQPNFLTSLQAVSTARAWGLNFASGNNQIIPCAQTARTILQVLLDHRLLSEVTQNIYDVPDAVQV
ncbi:DUF4868 domain-containing protein (plasmid) [Paraburkholderia terrae]|uniref:DUF4868 domain-containing protein n=1 Tax=Paraburkholderia terrae TaxID=311230 RepID=A0ABM7U354_9BURK|nr:DUF4868 domain-containing protein [Paraburkholderia terrae]BCZ85753.1 DUF4868 domain-containing protein [Paraburkholderia terrae]